MAAVTTTLLGLGAALALALAWEGEKEPSPPDRPSEWDDKATEGVFEVRNVGGAPVRFFKPQFQDAVVQMVTNSHVVPIPEQNWERDVPHWLARSFPAGTAAIMRIDLGLDPNTQVSTLGVLREAVADGFAVLGNLDLALPETGVRYIALVRPSQMHLASPASRWAVLMVHKKHLGQPADDIPPGGVIDQPAKKYDDNMSPELRRLVDDLIADENISPDALEMAADKYAPQYPIAARRLRRRAEEIRKRIEADHLRRGHSPFRLRNGDLAANLAKHYTGDGMRWREIMPLNPKLKIVNGRPDPWYAGLVVKLPLDWRVWEKPLPAVVTGGKTSDWQKVADDLGKAKEVIVDHLPPEPIDNRLPKNVPPWENEPTTSEAST